MRFYLVICAIFITGAVKGYEVIIHRTDTIVYENNDILTTATPITSEQPITFLDEISDENTLNFAGTVIRTTPEGQPQVVAEFDWDRDRHICANFAKGSWEADAAKILILAWTPENKCPVAEGEYTIKEPIGPLVLDEYEKLYCGEYSMDLTIAYLMGQDAVKSKYVITILDDDRDC